MPFTNLWRKATNTNSSFESMFYGINVWLERFRHYFTAVRVVIQGWRTSTKKWMSMKIFEFEKANLRRRFIPNKRSDILNFMKFENWKLRVRGERLFKLFQCNVATWTQTVGDAEATSKARGQSSKQAKQEGNHESKGQGEVTQRLVRMNPKIKKIPTLGISTVDRHIIV